MPACRLGPLAAALLLCLLLFGFTLVPGTEAEKTGVCPELQADQNCTQECVSDSECADNLKCCSAGCATFCSLPNALFHRLKTRRLWKISGPRPQRPTWDSS
uniref:WAP four-disulfide core domain protein 2 n=1 Tax=Pongo abelii TaxID=9601 RepID=A0A8I5YPM2_PONAB